MKIAKSKEKKIFGTDGIRGKANSYPITAEMALLLGKAIAHVFSRKKGFSKDKIKIVIGKDTRLSGYMLESALQAGICSMGADVLLVGPMPTPAIAHLTKSLNADAGIVISASHNPAEDNGIKIFSRDGYKLPDEVEIDIEDMMINSKMCSEHIHGKLLGKAYRVEEAYGRYIEFAKASISSDSLSGFKLVIDCANGAAYKIAPKIFSELGAEVIILNNTPDGLNINMNCGATSPKIIQKEVIRHKADAGIALDGDADRIIMCDEKGQLVCGDKILGLIAEDMKNKGTLDNDKIVITIMSNIGLKKFLDYHKISYIESPVGDRYVIEAMRNNNIVLGGEQSGHIILSKYVTTGDGMISALNILKIMKEKSQKLSMLSSRIKMYPQKILNVRIREKQNLEDLKTNNIIKECQRRLVGIGRVLVRFSGTEPVCRIMVEANKEKLALDICKNIADHIKKEIGVKG